MLPTLASVPVLVPFPRVSLPRHWPTVEYYNLDIRRFNQTSNHFEVYDLLSKVKLPGNVTLEPGHFYDVKTFGVDSNGREHFLTRFFFQEDYSGKQKNK